MAKGHMKWQRLGENTLPTEDADTGLGHIVSVPAYKIVFASLLLLTGFTVWAATQDFGVLNLVVALGIATLKAAVVTLFFMHLNWEGKIAWGIVIYPLFVFVIILGSTLTDSMVKTVPMPRRSDPEAVRPHPTVAESVGQHDMHTANPTSGPSSEPSTTGHH